MIEDHFRDLQRRDYQVSAREAGKKMIQIFRELTGEMPQAAGIDAVLTPDELPALEWGQPEPTTQIDDSMVIDIDPVPPKRRLLGKGQDDAEPGSD